MERKGRIGRLADSARMRRWSSEGSSARSAVGGRLRSPLRAMLMAVELAEATGRQSLAASIERNRLVSNLSRSSVRA